MAPKYIVEWHFMSLKMMMIVMLLFIFTIWSETLCASCIKVDHHVGIEHYHYIYCLKEQRLNVNRNHSNQHMILHIEKLLDMIEWMLKESVGMNEYFESRSGDTF